MTDNTTAFFIESFANWKKATVRFRVHQTSEFHKESKLKLSSINVPTIQEQLSTAAAEANADHTRMLLKVSSSLSTIFSKV